MTLPLEVDFCNMPCEPGLEAAAQDELRGLEPAKHLTSCRVRITRLRAESTYPRYDVRIVVLSGAHMASADCGSSWSRYLSGDGPETALHRAFAKIHAQLRAFPA